MKEEAKIIHSFWHKTRRCCVPLTRDELQSRSGVPEPAFSAHVRALLASQHLVSCKHSDTKATIYDLNPRSQAQLSELHQLAGL